MIAIIYFSSLIIEPITFNYQTLISILVVVIGLACAIPSFRLFAKNKTTITVAHKLSNIVSSDQIILFNKGKVVDIGKHEELIKKSTLYKKLYYDGN